MGIEGCGGIAGTLDVVVRAMSRECLSCHEYIPCLACDVLYCCWYESGFWVAYCRFNLRMLSYFIECGTYQDHTCWLLP